VCGGVIQTIAIAGIIITTRKEDKLRWYYHGGRGLGRRELRRMGGLHKPGETFAGKVGGTVI